MIATGSLSSGYLNIVGARGPSTAGDCLHARAELGKVNVSDRRASSACRASGIRRRAGRSTGGPIIADRFGEVDGGPALLSGTRAGDRTAAHRLQKPRAARRTARRDAPG